MNNIEKDNVFEIIEKWYKRLGFPEEYDEEFYEALKIANVSENLSIGDYDLGETDGKKNLVSFLYFCEATEKEYIKKGISPDICYDTLSDLVAWTKIWSGLKGGLYFGETNWLKRHLNLELFKLGRLQFCAGKAHRDMPTENIAKGDNVIEIHIPTTGTPMKYEDCVESIKLAKEFFAKHFPEYEYKGFTCNSWLLDTSLGEILDENSNIMKFQSLFNIVYEEKAEAIMRYTFSWDMDKEKIRDAKPASRLAEKVKERVLNGGDFYSGLGAIKKELI